MWAEAILGRFLEAVGCELESLAPGEPMTHGFID